MFWIFVEFLKLDGSLWCNIVEFVNDIGFFGCDGGEGEVCWVREVEEVFIIGFNGGGYVIEFVGVVVGEFVIDDVGVFV